MLSVCCVSPCELVFPSMCELVFLRGECKWEHIVGEEASWLPRPQTQHNALSYLKRKAKKMTESGRVEFLIYLQICAFPTPTSQYVGFSCLCWNWVELRLGIVLFFKLLFCGCGDGYFKRGPEISQCNSNSNPNFCVCENPQVCHRASYSGLMFMPDLRI